MAPLTEQQLRVATLVAEGYTDRQIATQLRVTPQRVGQMVRSIARRLDVDDERDVRVQIAVLVAAARDLSE